MDNFNLKKYLVENKVTTNSKMMNENEEVPFSDNNLKKVVVAGTTYEVGSDDPNDEGITIAIEKHPKGYFIMGQTGREDTAIVTGKQIGRASCRERVFRAV